MRALWTALPCAVLAALSSSPVARAAPADSGAIVIADARIYPSPDAAPIEHGVVVVRDGKIIAVGAAGAVHAPKGAQRIDAHGATVVAGFWNSHIHLMLPDMLEAQTKSPAVLDKAFETMLTRWGFTTVFDIASGLENTGVLRRRIEAGEIDGPMILTTGDPFFPENGTPIYVRDFFAAHHFPNMEVKTPEAAAARAARQLDAGADGVKIFAGAIVDAVDGDRTALPMRLDIAKAVVEAAHKRGKPAFAHPSNFAGLNVAIDSGVDVLAHTTPDAPWTPELVKRIREHGMALTPTLTLFNVELSKVEAPPAIKAQVLQTAVSELKAYADAGGQILFGTDVGYTQAFDTTEEYQLMGRALGWRAILASLTTAPAKRFGYASRKGRIAPDMDADLVVLDGDPAADVTAFARVRYTLRGGRVIYANDGPTPAIAGRR
jgi:imidazolonepropionase-like amidohydrolase